MSGNGLFNLVDVEQGNYTLQPRKSDNAEGISAYDASLVLQHSAESASSAEKPHILADVDRNGSVTPMDAFLILQRSVGLIDLPFNGAGAVWIFTPSSRSYTSLSTDQSAQNFTAALLGDVSGNWGTPQNNRSSTPPLSLWLQKVPADDSLYELVMDAGASQTVMSLDIRFESVGNAITVESAPALAEALVSVNPLPNGTTVVGIASGIGLTGRIPLLTVRVDGAPDSPLHLSQVAINEGQIPVTLDESPTQANPVYLPLVDGGE